LNLVGEIIGEVCKKLLPIPEEIYLGNSQSTVAICTLSSIDLLKKIVSSNLMNKVAIVGRLLSENKGIDLLVRYVISNKNIETIILCGNDVWGHKAGDSLLSLMKNGIDENGRIIESKSPDPILTVSHYDIEKFRNQVKIIDKINLTDIDEIANIVYDN